MTEAQPEFLTIQWKRNFLAMLRLGAFFEEACRGGMITPATFATWRERGERDEEPYRTFIRECDRAVADSIKTALRSVQRDSKRDGRVALEWLRRRHSDWNRSYSTVDAQQQKKLDELDLSAAGIATALEEVDGLGGNVLKLKRSKNDRAKEPSGAGQRGDRGDDGALHPGEVAEAAEPQADGGSGGAL